MNDGTDPYFNNKMSTINSNFLNFGAYANSTNPQIFCFSGNAYSFKSTVHSIKQQDLQKIRSLRINITGTQVKTGDTCCFYSTIVFGSILIFPLFFICCDWWKRKVNKLYNVQNQGYDALTQLIHKTQAQDLYLMVQDNFFNRSKGQVIIETLHNSTVKNFVFNNVAAGFDADHQNYTNFDKYMRPIKSQMMKSDVSWANKALL